MRRPFFVAIASLFLIAALLPTWQVSSTMFSRSAAVGSTDDPTPGSYDAAPKSSDQNYSNSQFGLASRVFINSISYILIQTDQQPVTDEGETSNISMWAIVLIVLVVLFLIVVVIVVGVTVLIVARRRSKAKSVTAGVSVAGSLGSGSAKPTPSYDAPAPAATGEGPAPASVDASASDTGKEQYPPSAPEVFQGEMDRSATIDLSRTIAISPQVDTAPMSYGSITFVSGALTGQTFEIKAEGANIGRDASTSQIVIADPRISKRHVWIGVRDGQVTIEDQASRNGTFLNDPKSARLTEGVLKDGDTVILGESDVARFEYRK